MVTQSTYGDIVNLLDHIKSICSNNPDIGAGLCVHGSPNLPESPGGGRWINDKTKLNAYNMNLINEAIEQLARHQAEIHDALTQLIDLITKRNAGWQVTTDGNTEDEPGRDGNGEIFNDYKENIAGGDYSHVEGLCNKSFTEAQHVQGRYNEIDSENKYAHIIGGGTSNSDRKNIHTVDWDGNANYDGNVTIPEGKDFIVKDVKLYNAIQQQGDTINKIKTDSVGQKDYNEKGHFRGEIFNVDGDNVTYPDDHGATGNYSQAFGLGTKANNIAQHVVGQYNVEDDDAVHIIGWGSKKSRKNIHTVDTYGNSWYSGDIYVGGSDRNDTDTDAAGFALRGRLPRVYSGTKDPTMLPDFGTDGDIYIMYRED